MLDRRLKLLFLFVFFILANIPSVLCASSDPIVYVSWDGSGDFNCNATNADLQINEALRLVAENYNYTTVYLKGPFTYVVNDTLFLGNDTTLAGDPSTIIKLADNASWVTGKPLIKESSFGNHNITIQGFIIDGNREGNTNVVSGLGYYNLIHLTHCQNITVRDMHLTNNHGDGLKTDYCTNIMYYDNEVYELGHDALYAIYSSGVEAYNNTLTCRTNSGLRLYNSNNASFHDNTITSNNAGGAGIEIQKWETPVMDNIEVYNNTIYRTALAGIWIFGSKSYPSSSANLHIHHNRIYDTGTRYNSKIIGGIVSDGFNALIENNVIDGTYGAGIVQNNVYSPGPDGSGYVLTVRNNIITNTRTSIAGGNGYGTYNALTGNHSFILQNNCFYNNSGGDYKGTQASPTDIIADPGYANRSIHDYHLKSKYGHWNGSNWFKDTISSPCIDAGYVFSDYSNEPEDNGDRINIGLYGNTEYASKSGALSYEDQVPIYSEMRITANKSNQSNAAIYSDRIVWQDARNDNSNLTSNIYLYNISTFKEMKINKNGSWASSPAISGYRIVWEDNRNGRSDIYMYDLSTSTETPITTNVSWQGHPVIYGNRIVWEDNRNGDWDIFTYNLTNYTETRVAANGSDQVRPAIYGDRIVWQDARNRNWDIYLYNLSTSSETRVTTDKSQQCDPAIFGDRIVWQDSRNGNWDIYMYNLTTLTETQVTKNKSDQFNPAISGGRIVWQDSRNGNSDIYMYTILTSSESQITVNESRQEDPAIYGGKIVWNDGRNGNSDIYTCTVSEEEPEPIMPVADFSSNVTQGFAPLSVKFTDRSKDSNGWKWIFGDGTNSGLQNPVHVYSKAGNYTVNLTVSNTNGISSKLAKITVLPQQVFPVANFSNNVTSGFIPLSVKFTDLSKNATGWNWKFGDGATSTQKNVTHTYSSAGSYTVNLTARNANGTSSKLATISVRKINPVITWNNPANITYGAALGSTQLNAKASVSGTFVYTPKAGTLLGAGTRTLHVDFTPTNLTYYSKVSKNVTITVKKAVPAITWSKPANITYGTALSSTHLNAKASVPGTFAYTPPAGKILSLGTHTLHVDFTPKDAVNYSVASKNVTINVTVKPVLPVANFNTNVTRGYAPLSVKFTDLSKSAASRNWKFGDGATSTLQSPTHVYSKAGNYTVNLTVTNTNGTNSKLAKITVLGKILPVANFSTNVTKGYAPLSVQFIDLSKQAVSRNWKFGDGGNSTQQNPKHTYSSAGNYIVNLTVSNTNGTNSKAAAITVLKTVNPQANFSSNVTSGKIPLNVFFSDRSTGTPTSWNWNFGDGTVNSTQRNPVHTYSRTGIYTVTLTVRNAAGSSTARKANYIIASTFQPRVQNW